MTDEISCARCGSRDAVFEFDDTILCIDCRGDDIADNTVLSKREGQVLELKRGGASHADIAAALNLAKPTVDEYSQRVTEKRREAENLIELLDGE